MPHCQLEIIVDYIESMLNRPIIELIINKGGSKPKRILLRKRQQKLEVKSFFSHIISKMGFIHLPEVDEHVLSLPLLTENREASDIFMITSKQFQIVTAMDLGFCAIPVIKFQCFMQNDF